MASFTLIWHKPLRRAAKLVVNPASIAACFENSLLSLSAENAAAVLQAQSAARAAAKNEKHAPSASPVIDGQMYENLPSRALLTHCLDEHKALAIVGWPVEDILYSLRHQPAAPSHHIILRLMKAIDADQSLETFENIVSEDPVLAYRFMVYTNSAALGLRTGVDSLRWRLATVPGRSCAGAL